MAEGRRFGATYEEVVALRDGTRARLRLVRPGDKPLFVAGFARLSRQSRYLRFFTGKDRLSDAELHYLTEIDGENHVAIGALAAAAPQEGLGVARFVRLRDEPQVAELAVTVIDAVQRRGLGRILCERLVEAARERGVEHLRAEILVSNVAMLGMLGELAVKTVEREEGDALLVDFPLPAPAPPAAGAPSSASGGLIALLLSFAARGLLSVRRVFARLAAGGP